MAPGKEPSKQSEREKSDETQRDSDSASENKADSDRENSATPRVLPMHSAQRRSIFSSLLASRVCLKRLYRIVHIAQSPSGALARP